MSAVNINFIVLSFFCHVVCNKNSASRETPPQPCESQLEAHWPQFDQIYLYLISSALAENRNKVLVTYTDKHLQSQENVN